ncbi:MAG: hydrogenase maturation nickel metallochaperone HypA [Deltaproteobacteria bacterium]|nr:hydrogenase maturation nickel metallochaperone HypA [Deltaproteobacteria bacterium]
MVRVAYILSMHEMGIAIRVVEIVKESLPSDAGVQVERINLTVGRLTAVVPDSLRMCMDVVSKGTPLEGAQLVFTEVPVRLTCNTCGEDSEIEDVPFACAACGSLNTAVVSGRELFVESVEIEEGDRDGD